MGENKDIRKQIAGHERNIRKHRTKIDIELRKEYPRQHLIKKWRADIRRAEERIELLKRRLERKRNNASVKKSSYAR